MPSTDAFPLPRPDRVGTFLRRDAVGGTLLFVAAAVALGWANSPAADSYFALRDLAFGPAALHLNLTVGEWAADGLLAVLFFVVGLELKQEFAHGSLRSPRRALVPIAAAVGGVVGPVLVYLAVVAALGAGDAARGWAVPAATDFAFAVAVLAIVGRRLPAAVRLFLLTLAVVDDLIAITLIAAVFTVDLAVVPLLPAAGLLLGFAVLTHRGVTSWWLLGPLGIATWTFVHASGVHATVAGVLLGLAVPARELAGRFEHRWRPFSAGVAAPIFALFAAGVAVGGEGGLPGLLAAPITVGIVAGLVVGKTVGVLAATFLATRLPGAGLPGSMSWIDVAAVAPLTGVGFTVSLLVGELTFGDASPAADQVKVGVLCGSLVAALIGGVLVLARAHRRRARTDADP